MMQENEVPSELQSKVDIAVQLEAAVSDKIATIKNAQVEIDQQWKAVEGLMIEHDIKQIKGEWGTLTIGERLNWLVDETILPAKFFKKVPNTKKITDTYRLEGADKTPKGCVPSITKYLLKRIK
jgi:hypothetical protein